MLLQIPDPQMLWCFCHFFSCSLFRFTFMASSVFFFANDSLQHQYSSWRINRWLLRKQLALAVTKFSIEKIVRLVSILMILYPRYQDIKGTSKPFDNSDASANPWSTNVMIYLSFFLLFFVPFFVHGVACLFFRKWFVATPI